ncbi:MAG TPA: ThiF family adenylyltransferase [Gemmatimonadales bacterium]|nr:ThiF family adenylyltransferase [Gemmatimonadales bacterium]
MRILLEELRPPLTWSLASTLNGGPRTALIVGSANVEAWDCVYVGSDGWEVVLSPDSPVAIGSLVNPIGAYGAACMAVGEVWKRLLTPHVALFPGRPIVPIDRLLRFSCFTYRSDSPGDENPPLPSAIDVGRLTIVGLGAGGGACAFGLASLPELRGNLTTIEPDEVNLSNLNRYVFAAEADARVKRPKTDVVEALFERYHGLTVVKFAAPFSHVVNHLSVADLRHVLAAVHSRQARRELQYETPEVMWDAGATEDGDFRIWRISFGRTECMFCKHPADQGDPERHQAAQLADLLGLDGETWLQKIRDNTPFSAAEVAKLGARRQSLCTTFDLPEEGQRYSDWYPSQCGRLKLPEWDQEIPIPFAPVMAGILLAGEVIKQRHFPSAVLPYYYGNTLVGNWMRKVLPYGRSPKPDCKFCQDPAYAAQFERRWGVRPG